MLPLPRFALSQERGHDGNGSIAGGHDFRLLESRAHRWPVALPGGEDKSAHGLGNQVGSLKIPVRSGLAKWRDGDHDEPGIDLA